VKKVKQEKRKTRFYIKNILKKSCLSWNRQSLDGHLAFDTLFMLKSLVITSII